MRALDAVGIQVKHREITPVYRLYNPNAGDHHYTVEIGEKDHLISVGWKYEEIDWHSDDNKAVRLIVNIIQIQKQEAMTTLQA